MAIIIAIGYILISLSEHFDPKLRNNFIFQISIITTVGNNWQWETSYSYNTLIIQFASDYKPNLGVLSIVLACTKSCYQWWAGRRKPDFFLIDLRCFICTFQLCAHDAYIIVELPFCICLQNTLGVDCIALLPNTHIFSILTGWHTPILKNIFV